ncbi:MAG: hypothetical protein KAI81_06210 [Candidatus Marinimicrobia bacterium]|nr:hypothetical protein [Candidatus Neomarinimicrobiota bacterium]
MIKIKIKFLFILIVLLSSLNAGVFDIYGIGRPVMGYGAISSGRGYTGLAVLDSTEVYSINPAALANKILTGFEVGMNAEVGMVNSNLASQNQGFRNATLSLPAGDNAGLQFSFNPLFTAEGGLITTRNDIDAEESIYNSGSLYRLQVAGAWKFSFGLYAGLSYSTLLGGYELSHDVSFSNENYQELHYKKISGSDGNQYQLALIYKLSNRINLGINYEITNEFTSRTLYQTYSGENALFLFSEMDTSQFVNSVIGQKIGFGISLQPVKKLRLNVDIILDLDEMNYLPSQFGIINEEAKGKAANHIGIGLEKLGESAEYAKYLEKITLRTGVFSDNYYLSKEHGAEISSKGVSLAFGLPFNKGRSILDLSLTAGINTAKLYNSNYLQGVEMNENFYQLQLSLRSFDRWFNTKGKYR